MAEPQVAPKEILPAASVINAVFATAGLDVFPQPPAGGVITVLASISVADACATLSVNNILCAPVIDDTQPADAGWSDRVLGICDFIGLVAWMLGELDGDIPDSFHKLLQHRQAFRTTRLRDVIGKGRWSQFVPVDARLNSALDVMVLLGKYGLHRVCEVQSPGGNIKNIITQSAVVSLLNECMEKEPFSKVASHSLEELGLASGETTVVTVRDTDKLLSAFAAIGSKHISAVPVVDAEGSLVGTISAKDLRSVVLNQELFAFLRLPISAFPYLSKKHIGCRSEDTLRVVMQRFVENQVHRLWVTQLGAAGKPQVVGVVALRDILAALSSPPAVDPFVHYFTAH